MNAAIAEAILETEDDCGAALSLFSGAGGLDLGLHASGWSVLAQIDMDADCVSTLAGQAARAKRQTECIAAKIEDVDPAQLRSFFRLKPGQLGLLAGGPPCQPFTTTGLRQGINDRRASSAFPAYLRYVAEFLPKALLLENVDGMLSAALRHRPLTHRGTGSPTMEWDERKGSFLHWFLTELTRLGYSVAWGVTEAADHGVPQLRQRAVLIGVHDGAPCFLPEPSYGPALRPYRTLRDVSPWGDHREDGPLPFAEGLHWSDGLEPGEGWRDLTEEVRQETMGAAYFATGGKSGWWRRLAWDEPAPTILGMPDHSSVPPWCIRMRFAACP